MRYLSFDIEATGLAENDYMIEFGMIPFCAVTGEMNYDLQRNWYIKCPSFEELKPRLDQWVIDHNEELINKAHEDGQELSAFKKLFEDYLMSEEVKEYFGKDQGNKIVLFGKSMNAIDLPFMNRDLGWNFMREHFHHQVLDLSSVVRSLCDLKILPETCQSGSGLMKHFDMGDVAHTALEDAVNTAKLYLKIKESCLK
ncbi:exonuclease domain-containing protein [Halobacteriovorax sp. HLS]|uniref:exonuclease domain-containing protein n=1 Tax=Halobacteriovorax sp. HLS TaxID=2234000 RepID=UPI000FDAF64A|nr:exonuclease domain-containing protein [Halobacteriovorax sp. HLS]